MRTPLVLTLCLGACIPQPNPEPRPPVILDAATPIRDGGGDFDPPPGPVCTRACSVLEWLGCEEGEPTPRGESCAAVCERSRAFPNFTLPTACVIDARSIDDARKCPGVRCK